jgi:hypothetical protein
MVRAADGTWQDELWAFDATHDNALAVVEPAAGADGAHRVALNDLVGISGQGPGDLWLSITGSPVQSLSVKDRFWTGRFHVTATPPEGALLVGAFRSSSAFTAVVVPSGPR